MQRLDLVSPAGRPLRLLCLGAHPDDIEIGAGATILRLLTEHPGAEVRWVVLSGSPDRAAEARASAAALAAGAGHLETTVFTFRDGFFPYDPTAVKEALAGVRDGFAPDLILTHRPDDLHQDHRFVGELTHQLFRDHLVLSYEIVKTDGDLTTPNLYVPLDRETVDAKVAHLLRHFPSQAHRAWFEAEAFRAILRLRGIESNAPSGYAEAFHARRVVI